MLGMVRWRVFLGTLFGIIYVMTEAVPAKRVCYRNTVLLLMVDALQVLRVVLQPVFGWNSTTYDVAKFCDIVYIFTWGWTHIVPRLTFFVIAFCLVSAAIGDALLVARVFNKVVDHRGLGPIKLLRFMVGLVVTLLFSRSCTR